MGQRIGKRWLQMKSNYGMDYLDQIAWSDLLPVGNAGKSQGTWNWPGARSLTKKALDLPTVLV